MNRIPYLILVGLAAGASLVAQEPGRGPRGNCQGMQASGSRAPIASNPIVELKGKITAVQLARGQGMPSLEIEEGGKTTKVVLGSMRYLMQQNFNPKAGDEVSVKGYKTGADVFAITATVAGGPALRLRDDNGWPVWAGWGRMGRCGCCGDQ